MLSNSKIPKLWVEGLDLNPTFMEELLKKDKKIMYHYGIATHAIKTGKYRNDKFKQRLKLEATKNEFIEAFLYKYLKRKNTIINIKNKLIMEFNFNFKRTKKIDEYEVLMKELDILLEINETEKLINQIEKKNKCNCHTKGFGFCFCIDDNGRFF